MIEHLSLLWLTVRPMCMKYSFFWLAVTIQEYFDSADVQNLKVRSPCAFLAYLQPL